MAQEEAPMAVPAKQTLIRPEGVNYELRNGEHRLGFIWSPFEMLTLVLSDEQWQAIKAREAGGVIVPPKTLVVPR